MFESNGIELVGVGNGRVLCQCLWWGGGHANLSLAADFHFHVRYYTRTVRCKPSGPSGGVLRFGGSTFMSLEDFCLLRREPCSLVDYTVPVFELEK
jgi:hypothetical protein